MVNGFRFGPEAVFTGRVLPPYDWGSRAGYEIYTAPFGNEPLADIDPLAMPDIWRFVAREQLEQRKQGFYLVKASPAWLVIHTHVADGKRAEFLFSHTGDLMFYDPLLTTFLGENGIIQKTFPEAGAAAFDLRLDFDVVEINQPHLYSVSRDNFGHWIYDAMPRLLATQRYFPAVADLPLVFDKILPDFPDYLDLFGFSNNPRTILPRNGKANVIYRFDELYVPAMLPALDGSSLLQQATATAAHALPKGGLKRLYLSRDLLAPRHRVTNEDEMQAHLEQRGFEICRPHLMGAQETIRLMQQAEILVLPYGASLGNLPLANPGAQIIILAPSFLVENRFDDPVLRYFRHYLLPLHQRVSFVSGEPPPEHEPLVDETTGVLNFTLETFDRPLVYDLRKLDICLMQAEKKLICQQSLSLAC
jgi:hypothetical protein